MLVWYFGLEIHDSGFPRRRRATTVADMPIQWTAAEEAVIFWQSKRSDLSAATMLTVVVLFQTILFSLCIAQVRI